jgi:serine/threonine-protein kinase
MNEGKGQDPLIGRTFRGYRIEWLIARGGMGAVYRARDESLPNVCKVIKVLLPELAADESVRAFVHDRFEREALAVSVLKHDNIAAIHTVGTLDEGQPCMLMDLVEGHTLDEVIRSYKGRVPPYRVMHYLCHVARGLDFAHAMGIVHRDLKPSNIMVCPTDNDPYFCKLLDFGMAKLTRPIVAGQLVPTLGGMGLGTPSFMAVEQFRHADEATALSDVYALAIIIWLMVTGELPWGMHDTTSALGLSALYETQRDKAPNPPPPGTLPPAWERTLRAALSVDPEARPQSVRHFMVELAVGLPPAGPHVKGGVEILRLIAPKFIAESGHDAETVRETPHRTIVVAWPRLETPVRPAAAGIPTRPALPRHVQPGQPTPVLRAGSGSGLSDAPASALPASISTLGASNGVILPTPQKANGRNLAFLAGAAAVATVVLVAVLGGGEQPAAAPQPPPAPIAAKPPQPDTLATPATRMPTAAAPAATTAPIAAKATQPATLAMPTTSMPTTPAPAAAALTAAATPAVVADPAPPTAGTPSSAPTPALPAPPSRPATRAPSSPTASTKRRSDEPRAQKRKFDPNAPAGGEEE